MIPWRRKINQDEVRRGPVPELKLWEMDIEKVLKEAHETLLVDNFTKIATGIFIKLEKSHNNQPPWGVSISKRIEQKISNRNLKSSIANITMFLLLSWVLSYKLILDSILLIMTIFFLLVRQDKPIRHKLNFFLFKMYFKKSCLHSFTLY